MRAAYPESSGLIDRDGVDIGYEVYGDGPTTILLLPTWTIIHSRFWKMQIPYLSRHFKVVTYDGPGNGRSERTLDPTRYTPNAYAADALAVLDAAGVGSAVGVGLSKGAQYGIALAMKAPERVAGLVMIGPSLPITPPGPERASIADQFTKPYPPDVTGWGKYNVAYWHDHYPDFAEFFFSQCFSEPHSTKPIEDSVGWALETSASVLAAEESHPGPEPDWADLLGQLSCPTLVIHGTGDRIQPHERGRLAAELSGGTLISMAGSGHIPNVRDPVKVNLAIMKFARNVAHDALAPTRSETTARAGRRDLIKNFVDETTGSKLKAQIWSRGLGRPKRALYVSSPIGLGHARRDLAIAQELKAIEPDLQVDWLAQDPVTSVLAGAGETIHPASEWLASESGHISSEASGHDLHCFQALRRMDEILLANFMAFQEVVEEGQYDLVVGDEAWEIDHYWHENPELKRGSHVWLTDFVGFIPMPEGGEREAFLTSDYNAEMIEHIARFPRIRDRAIFVGNPDDIYPDTFGPDLPKIRDWTEEHFGFSGYITGFTPPTGAEAEATRADLGFGPEEKVCLVTVGGSGVGQDLLEKVIAAYPLAKERLPELRMIAVAGPRIDPASLPTHPGLEIHGYVDRLYRHLSVCDLAVVQGGLTTTMELTAAGRPFLYFPLRNHFEQNFHVRHRLGQYGAGTHMDYAATDAEALADAIVANIGHPVEYRPVETDGAARAARMIAELI